MDKLSAWMDGELDEALGAAELGRIKRDAQLRERWDTFHLIGDAMRGEPLLSLQFQQQLSERLSREPTVLAPRRRSIGKIATYGLSAAASLAAVAAVGWVALSSDGTSSVESPAIMAQGPVRALQTPPVVNVPDNGRMHEYLLAHMGVSPSTALQGLAPYILTVTVQQSAEGQ